MSDGETPTPRRPVTLESLLLVALVSAVIGVYWQMGSLRADMLDRFLVVEQRLGEVGQETASVRLEMERRFGEVNERLARIETLIQRLDPDFSQPAD
ncbi:MAG: hypothetical protein OYL41_07375 [Acidobacteriota bacterium]|nr:hypothetical protein [Acidobacteriota bacterium]